MSRIDFLPFFQWCDQTSISIWIRDSTWAFPVIEIFHLLALTLLFGTTLLLDLRLIDAGLRRQSLARLAHDLWPWMTGGLWLILFTGVLLFLSEAMKCFGNDPFWFKMASLAVAMVFHFTVFRSAVMSADANRYSPASRRLVALVSILLWVSVGGAGRAIGFV